VYGCPPWTKPGAVKDILQKENILPSHTVLVGDSYGDQKAANETGVHFIGRNSGLLFEDPQPAILIENLEGLAGALTN
jgi:phosphoglycolate phosphatase-like HAD superfamily hydrolase